MATMICRQPGVWWATACLVHGVAALTACGPPPPATCEAAVQRALWPEAVELCSVEYREAADEEAGLRLANAHLNTGDMPAARAVALELLGGPARGAALRVLSVTAQRRSDPMAAVHATAALAVHAASGDRSAMMSDLIALAAVWWAEGAYDASLATADAARELARHLGDRAGEGAIEIARADVFRELGAESAAEHALASAAVRLTAPCDLSWVYFKQGLLKMRQDNVALAEIDMERCLPLARGCEQSELVGAVHHNLAWLAAEQERAQDAERHLVAAGRDAVEALILRAAMSAEHGDLARADEHLARAAGQVAPEAQWTWVIASLRAEIAEIAGRDADAEAAYRRAIALAATLRSRATVSAAYVVANHRRTSERLIALLARAGRWKDALDVIVDLDGYDLLRTTTAAGGLGPEGAERAPGVRPMGVEIAMSDTSAVSADDVLAAWRGRDLVIVVATGSRMVNPGGDRVWRLRVRDGEVTGEDVGDAVAAEQLADDVMVDPADLGKANALGAMMVPVDASTESLFVLPVGVLSKAPLAALRRGGALVLAQRPLVRVLGIRPRRDATPARSGAAVFGDPRLDLKKAQGEARDVAKVLGVDAAIGPEATIAAVLAASRVATLHLAAHSDDRGQRTVLHLADGDLGADEILRAGLSPGLAFLASCGSAVAGDEESWGSLAAAFLASGTERVIATQRTILDESAAVLVRAFYEEHRKAGFTDPERALAAAQVRLAGTVTSNEWAFFTVLASPPPAVAR
jgi:hypothetical protein